MLIDIRTLKFPCLPSLFVGLGVLECYLFLSYFVTISYNLTQVSAKAPKSLKRRLPADVFVLLQLEQTCVISSLFKENLVKLADELSLHSIYANRLILIVLLS